MGGATIARDPRKGCAARLCRKGGRCDRTRAIAGGLPRPIDSSGPRGKEEFSRIEKVPEGRNVEHGADGFSHTPRVCQTAVGVSREALAFRLVSVAL